MTETAGEQFVRAFTARDGNALHDLLADSIDFRGLTPGRAWEGRTSREVVDEILLGHWLDETDHVTELISVATGRVADREHVAYRFRLENTGVSYIAEQQAYTWSAMAGSTGCECSARAPDQIPRRRADPI